MNMGLDPEFKPLDLCSVKWTQKDFQENILAAPKEKTVGSRIFYKKRKEQPEQSPKSLIGKNIQMVRKWRRAALAKLISGSENIHDITKQIDQVAMSAVAKEVSELAAIDLLPKKEREQKLKEMNQRIGTITSNLEEHNRCISAFNQQLIFKDRSISACQSHDTSISRLKSLSVMVDEEVKQLKQENKKETVKLFREFVDQLEKGLGDGLPIDRYYVRTIYRGKMEEIKEFTPLAEDKEEFEGLIRKFRALTNRGYVQTLQRRVMSGEMPLPDSITIILQRLGYAEKIDELFPQAKEQFIQQLESQYADLDTSLGDIDSGKLVNDIQSQALTLAGKLLFEGDEQKVERLRQLLKVFHDYEVTWNRVVSSMDRRGKTAAQKMLNKEKTDPLTWPMHANFTFAIPFSESLNQILDDVLEQKGRVGRALPSGAEMLEGEQDAFDKLVEDVKSLVNHSIGIWSKGEMESRFSKSFKEWEGLLTVHSRISPWYDPDKGDRCWFTYSQGLKGDDQVLGQGCCLAINYRWIKYLLHHPEIKEAVSHEQMDISAKEQDQYVKREDRIIQASYSVSRSVGHDYSSDIPRYVLEKDSLVCNNDLSNNFVKNLLAIGGFIEKPSSLIDFLIKDSSFDQVAGNGIVDIGIGSKGEGGHAIGMQVNERKEIFRFWDVNYGFFEFSSLERMKDAMDQYLSGCYSGWKVQLCVQYLPKTQNLS